MEERREGHPWIAIVVSALLAVYFFFPALIGIPLYTALKTFSIPIEASSRILFWPQNWLYDNVPVYHSLIKAELHLLEPLLVTLNN